MDGERFDRLAKDLATAVDRRRVLKGVSAAAAAALAGVVGRRRTAVAQEGGLGSSCGGNDDCASGTCCAAGTPREGLCGIPTGEPCPASGGQPNNNACCSGSCFDTVGLSDPADFRCRELQPAGEACDVGDIGDCQAGLVCCIDYTAPISHTGFACTDPNTDPRHCGGCNVACDPTEVCVGGECLTDLGYACLEGGNCASALCCPPGSARAGLCGLDYGQDCVVDPAYPLGSNNACCSGACIEGTCQDRHGPGEVCDAGDQADCQAGLTCCDNYGESGPDFFCTDTSTDALNCGGCSQTGGRVCDATQVCVNSTCLTALGGECTEGAECASGVCSPISQECIVAGTCPSGQDAECFGRNQVCCGDETDKPSQCVGQGRDGGDRACYRGQ